MDELKRRFDRVVEDDVPPGDAHSVMTAGAKRRRIRFGFYALASVVAVAGVAAAGTTWLPVRDDRDVAIVKEGVASQSPAQATDAQVAVAALRALNQAGLLDAGGSAADFKDVQQQDRASWVVSFVHADCSGMPAGVSTCQLDGPASISISQEGSELVVTQAQGFGKKSEELIGYREALKPEKPVHEFGTAVLGLAVGDLRLVSIPTFWTGPITNESLEAACVVTVGDWKHSVDMFSPIVEGARDSLLAVSVPSDVRGRDIGIECGEYKLASTGVDGTSDGKFAPPRFSEGTWHSSTSGSVRDGHTPAAWTSTINLGPGFSYRELRKLDADDAAIYVHLVTPADDVNYPTEHFPNRETLRFEDAQEQPSFEGQWDPDIPVYRLFATTGGHRVSISIWFGTPRPAPELIAEAQRQLDRLVIPPPY